MYSIPEAIAFLSGGPDKTPIFSTQTMLRLVRFDHIKGQKIGRKIFIKPEELIRFRNYFSSSKAHVFKDFKGKTILSIRPVCTK